MTYKEQKASGLHDATAVLQNNARTCAKTDTPVTQRCSMGVLNAGAA
jgi:hypothetical protein